MPGFRCTMLDARGDVLFPADIVADTQTSAIHHARDIQRMSNKASSASNRVFAFEVWSGSRRLHSESSMKQPDSQVRGRSPDSAALVPAQPQL